MLVKWTDIDFHWNDKELGLTLNLNTQSVQFYSQNKIVVRINMVAFTPNQTTAFFTNGSHMAIPKNIPARLVLEGLINFNDFNNFKYDQLNQSFKNMCTAIPGIPGVAAAGGAAVVPGVAPVPPVLVSEKCDICLKLALIAYHYYISIGRSINPANMN